MGQSTSSSRQHSHLTCNISMGQSTSSLRCMLDRLADVELQLIMHGLTAAELLQFARCNRRLMHAADSPFAWRHSILRFWSSYSLLSPHRALLMPIAPPPPSRLLRHASIGIRWSSRTDSANMSPADATTVASCAQNALTLINGDADQFVEFDASSTTPSVASVVWNQLFIQPVMQSLTTIYMHGLNNSDGGEVAHKTMIAITKLSKLQTLRLSYRRPKGEGIEAALVRMHSLTALQLGDNSSNQDGDSCLPLVAQCQHLTLLDVRSPAIRGKMFRQLFAESNLRTLKSLQLTNFDSGSVSSDDYIATFTAMQHLQSLHLHSLAAVPIMTYLRHASVLQCFALQLPPFFLSTHTDWILPTMTAFADLLLFGRPSLDCTLLFASAAILAKDPQSSAIAAVKQRKLLMAASVDMRQLAHEVQSRFQVRCELEYNFPPRSW